MPSSRIFVVWVWHHTPNCAEMSRLTSRALDPLPGLKLRGQVWLHPLICVWSRRYFAQHKFLRAAAPQLHGLLAESMRRGLSPEARRQMIQTLRGQPGIFL